MRLLSLDLERYGAFAGRRLAFAPGALLHLVHGANEAGKTTLLAAMSDLLFGFEPRISFAFQHPADTLRLGAKVLLPDGSTRNFRRRRGNKITLVDEADQPLGEDYLDDIRGGLTRDAFRSEFGLTAGDLREGGRALLATKGRLADMLATGSAGLSALLTLEKALGEEADARFGERNVASKPFYTALKEHAAASAELKLAVVNKPELAGADALLAERQAVEAALDGEQKTLLAQKERLTRIGYTGPVLLQLDACRAGLEALVHLPPSSEGQRAQWQAALALEMDMGRQLEELAQDQARDDERLAGLQRDPQLLALAGEIVRLQGDMGAVKRADADLANRIADRDDATLRLENLAQRLGAGDIAGLLARQPTETELISLRGHVSRARQAAETQVRTRETVAERMSALEKHPSSATGAAHVGDSSALRQRLESFSSVPGECDKLRHETAQVAVRHAETQAAIGRLQPAVGGLAAMAALALPATASLQQARQHQEGFEREASELAARRKAITLRRDAALADIAGLPAQGAGATHEALAAARAARDAALDRLEAVLDQAGADRSARLAALRALGARADDLADGLIRDGAQAGRRQVAMAQHQAAQAELASLGLDEAALNSRQAQWRGQWAAMWAPAQIVPLDPAAMIGWCETVKEILVQDRALADRRASIAAQRAGLDEKRLPLLALARDIGIVLPADLPLELACQQARLAMQALEKAWDEARGAAATRRALADNLARAEQEAAAAAAQAETVRPAWLASVLRLGLAVDCGHAEAETALKLWEEVEKWRGELADATHRISGMLLLRQAFERDVAALPVQAGELATGMPAMQVLETLVQRLGECQRAQGDWDGLARTKAARLQRAATLHQRLAAAGAVSAQAQTLLPPGMDLSEALSGLERRSILEAEQTAHQEALRRNAAGRSEADLRAEFDAFGGVAAMDEIEGRRQSVEAGIEALRQRLGAAIAARVVAAQAREALERGRHALQAQQAVTEAGAQMQQIAEAWLVRHGAARLARAAIEQHRAQAQHPVVARASALFNAVTGGSFAGLVADFDEKEKSTLKGQRAGGARVGMDEMSEGTRDQLFLVLRLALLEQRRVQALPFVGDDLLASFDEPRAGAMLEMLADFGARNQVILFTHHAHLVELAQARLGQGVDVLRL